MEMKKNVIILHTDQQRYDSLGCNGNPDAKTENIDALAKDGCRFTRHISTNPTCMPSRASLFTGLYVPGHGVSSNGIPLWRRAKGGASKSDEYSMKLFGIKVEDKIPTLADKLGECGYHTALFGKLHLQPHLADASNNFYENNNSWEDHEIENDNQEFYGFQTKKIILGHGEQVCEYNRGHYARWLSKNYPEIAKLTIPGEDTNTTLPGAREDIYLSKIPSEYHNTMWLADEACQYIDSTCEQEAPMFMFVGFPDPHHPFTPPMDIAKEFMNIPLPEFASRDKIVGEKATVSMNAMKAYHATKSDCEQAYRNTMASVYLIDKAVGKIIDHLKKKKLYDDTIIIFTSDHGDFLGDYDMLCKSNLPYHNLLHLPFILKGTKDMELPSVMDTPMSNADVVPTILSMLGIEKDAYIQGVDIFDKNNDNNMPMVTSYGVTLDGRNISLYNDTYRYTYYLDTKEEELYNHKNDIKELNNLVNDPSFDAKEICRTFKERLFEKHIECHSGIFNHYSLW